MNCCQPEHAEGLAAPLQLDVWKVLVLSWSAKELAFPLSASLVTPVTLSKDPVAADINPDTWAEKSLPLPVLLGRGPPAGG